MSQLPLVIGVVLAIAVGLFATWLGLDRDRAFYPVVMIVIAVLYSLFAVMGGSTHALILEIGVGAIFIVAASAGFKTSLWIVAAALAAHGIYDFTHRIFFSNPGVPDFWPAFCGGYDVAAALYLAWLIRSRRVPSLQSSRS